MATKLESSSFSMHLFEKPASYYCSGQGRAAQPKTTSEDLVTQYMTVAQILVGKRRRDVTETAINEALKRMAKLSLEEPEPKAPAFAEAVEALVEFNLNEDPVRPVTLVTAKTLLSAAVRFCNGDLLSRGAALHIIDIVQDYADEPALAYFVRGAKRAIGKQSCGVEAGQPPVCPASKIYRTGCGLHRDSYAYECTCREAPMGEAFKTGVFKTAARMGLSFLHVDLDTAPAIPAALRKIMRRQMRTSVNEFLEMCMCPGMAEPQPEMANEAQVQAVTVAYTKAILDAAKGWDNDRASE